MKRNKMSKGRSKAVFRRTASRTNKRNLSGGSPMRGGIRL